MKKRLLNLAILVAILSCAIIILTGCGKEDKTNLTSKTETLTVYINDNLNNNEITTIENKLKGLENVTSIEYTSKEQAYEEAKIKLGEDAINLSGYTKTIHPFPAYFTLEVKDDKNIDDFAKEITKINGVKEVQIANNINDLISAEINHINDK